MEFRYCSLIAFVLCWCSVFAAPKSSSYCFSQDNDKPQLKHFTSKGIYQIIKGKNFEEEIATPNCKPSKVWVLSRHGTRLPKIDQIEDMPNLEVLRDNIISNYENPVKGGLCDEDFQLIENWVFDKNITVDKRQHLTTQGFDDMKILGQDFKKAFPELLSVYNGNKVLLRHISTQVSQDSYKALVEGLIGEGAHEFAKLTPIPKKDYLLRSPKLCVEWTERADENKDAGTEAASFKKSDAMLQSLARVSARLGFKTPLKYKPIKQLWDICRFEAAWFINDPSTWCTAFTMEDVLVFEYLDDLGNQFASGDTFEMNRNIPCEPIKDLLTHLMSKDDPNVIFYISNSDLIQLLSTALGLQKESTFLTSASFSKANNRKFRTSVLDPMAANFAFVKYDCSADPVDPSDKIKFFLNQRLHDFEGCPRGFCKLSDFVAKFKKYLNADCKNIFCTSTVL